MTTKTPHLRELGEFLKVRRGELTPAEVGLPELGAGQRRVAGLRREEVAQLVSISPDYYMRIEQGRLAPSPSVLKSLARALRLDTDQTAYVEGLVGHTGARPQPRRRTRPSQVHPHLQRLLGQLEELPAMILGPRLDIIAWNPLAEALLGDLAAEPNLARRRFLRRGVQETSASEEFADIAVARLRGSADRYPRDARLAGLLAELRLGSAEFAAIWDTNPVRAAGHRVKTLPHPQAGPLRLNCDVLHIPEDDQQVVLMTADPGTPTARALRRLLPAN